MPALSIVAGAESRPCTCDGCKDRPAITPDRRTPPSPNHSFANVLRPEDCWGDQKKIRQVLATATERKRKERHVR